MPMGTLPNRGIFGLPELPYADNQSYDGADVFIDLTFLDANGVPVTPSSFSWVLNDITNALAMVGKTTVTSPVLNADMQYTLQIPGTVMQLSRPFQGSQLCQLSMYFNALDSVTGNAFVGRGIAIIELVAIQTPFNDGC